MLINADLISVERKKKLILDQVSLTVEAHDFITILGPNGAGKSMLLKCLMKLYAPSSGTVTHKEDIKIGYVPQKIDQEKILPLTVKRFLTLKQQSAPKTFFDEIITQTNIETLLNMPLSQLSGGQLQRVLLARALYRKPDILILDEAEQNLDISGQLAFYKLLETLHYHHKMAILMVSHNLHLVMSSTKKVICLYHHICCSGVPKDIIKHPDFISLFGDDMTKMLSYYPHHHAHNHT